MADKIVLKNNDVLVKEGDQSSELFYLQKGSLGVFKRVGDTEKQIGTIYAGEVVGEMSFLDKAPRSATVKAINDCELVVVPGDKYDKIVKELPPWYNALVNTLLDRLRKANARIRI